MDNKSIWESDVEIESFPFLNEDIKTNVLIIGGGITGILCAYELKKRNINSVIVEKNKICKGITKNTTAFIAAQHEVLYQDLISKHGEKVAKEYLTLNLQAIKKFKELGEEFDIDFKECTSMIFTNESEDIILKEKIALDSLGYHCSLSDSLPLDIPIKKGLTFKNQATIHPLKLIKNLVKDLTIYEETSIERLYSNCAYTKNHKIKFNSVIIASHFPFVNTCGLYFMKMYQRRSYVVAFKDKKINGTFCSIDPDGLYFRNHGDYLIIGGNDRDTKNICKCSFENKIKNMFKNRNIEYSWSNQDCITLDKLPYIGRYSILHKNWYVATGFNLWGFTWAMASSILLADYIENKRKSSFLNPNRNMFNIQLVYNVLNTLKNMITFRTPRCSHLKTALLYNKEENTWECPSHGSRFNNEGNVLDGPAQKKIKR